MISIRHDQRGATAIEYAVIAGLIGIGLIGSLVGTKGSLNAIFGMTASQMGSSTVDVAPPSRASYWSAKTLVSRSSQTVSGFTTTTFRYQDGTVVGYTQNASHSVQSVQVADPALQTSAETVFSNGVLEHYLSTTFAGDMTTPVSRQYAYQNQGQIQTDGTLVGMTAQSNYSNGDFRSTTTGSPTSVFRQVVQSGISDLVIFDQMSR